jgi:hypothetical protein
MKRRPPRSRNWGNTLTRALVWVVLAIFVLTSVGVALITVQSR